MTPEQHPWQQAITICSARHDWPTNVVSHLKFTSHYWTAESCVALARDIGWRHTPTPWELEPMRRCCLTHSFDWYGHFLALAEGTLEVVGRITPRCQVEEQIDHLTALLVGETPPAPRYLNNRIRFSTRNLVH